MLSYIIKKILNNFENSLVDRLLRYTKYNMALVTDTPIKTQMMISMIGLVVVSTPNLFLKFLLI